MRFFAHNLIRWISRIAIAAVFVILYPLPLLFPFFSEEHNEEASWIYLWLLIGGVALAVMVPWWQSA